MFRRLKQIGLVVVVLLGSMIAMGVIVSAIFPSDWQPVQATVQSTHIESVRNGVPEWAVRADLAYEVSGETYETWQDVFTNTDREVSVAELENWPQGRELTLYVNTASPTATSLYPDGGQEGAVVAAVILTPALVGLIWFVAFLISRSRRNAREEAG